MTKQLSEKGPEDDKWRVIMKNSELYAIGSFLMIAFAMLLIWDLGIWAWFGIFFALYSGASYGWHREALRKEKEDKHDKN